MRLIKMEDEYGNSILVNADNICVIEELPGRSPLGDRRCAIRMGAETVAVKGSLGAVDDLIFCGTELAVHSAQQKRV
jgi:hypothetical protein